MNEALSQRARIEDDLRRAGPDGVCSLRWYQSAAPNSRNVISAMRAAGHHIDVRVCGDEHPTSYRRYTWRHDNTRRCPTCPWMGEQQRLPLEEVSA